MSTVKKGAAAATAPVAEIDDVLVEAYLGDRMVDALLERGEPSKISEIAGELDNPRLTFPLLRKGLIASKRFVQVERSWDLAARYVDTARPTARLLQDILRAAGRPLSTASLVTEYAIIQGRPADVFIPQLPRWVAGPEYFRLPSGEVALIEWLPLLDGETEEEIFSDNGVKSALIRPLKVAAAGLDWSEPVGATLALLERLRGQPLRHRTVGVLAFLAVGEGYDAKGHLSACWSDPRLVWLDNPKGGRWIARATADRIEMRLGDLAAALGDEEEEVFPPEPEIAVEAATDLADEAEAVPAEPLPAPLAIADADLVALAALVAESDGPMDAQELLARRFEVVPGDPSYRSDLECLLGVLAEDERFVHVGAGRFRAPDTFPPFIHSIPEILAFPDLQFISMDGEIMDEEIEDEGFAGSLRQDVLHPVAQDAGDDEGGYTGPESEDPDAVVLVVKAHHKEIGTFPLCQFPDGFLPSDAPVVEIVLREVDGTAHPIIVNRNPEVRLAFGFFELYERIPQDSGGRFRLARTVRPWEFRFEPLEEPDDDVAVDAARAAELASLKEHVEESEEMATFDILCEVLDAYPKGATFVRLMTDVNLVRRVTRRKLASILSNYFCFAQKAGTNIWRFDPKKREMGTDRAKRKYIKR
ncbi:MAG: hypothetical protein ACKO5K_09200 [Armatimonadota bacterium]